MHAFTSGDHVVLGGERVPHSHGVLAHSDGDVLLHAICDAVLGALDSAISACIFRTATRTGAAPTAACSCASAAAAAGWRLSGRQRRCDCDLRSGRALAHRDAMRANIGSDLGLDAERVNVKATTTEGARLHRPRRRPGVPGDRPDRADDGNTSSVTVFEEMAALPCAHGGPAGRAQLRATPEDFLVQEWLGWEADGLGDHLLLKVRKRGANTLWVAKQLARLAKIDPRDVGFAGLKDRDAVAEQSFTVPARSAIGESWVGVGGEGFEVVAARAPSAQAEARCAEGQRLHDHLACVQRRPDSYWSSGCRPSRAQACRTTSARNASGATAGNLRTALAWFADGVAPADRWQRGFALSAARAAIFNAVIARRVSDGTWNRLLPGEIVNLDGSGSVFVADAHRCRARRALRVARHSSDGPAVGRAQSAPAARLRSKRKSSRVTSPRARAEQGGAGAGTPCVAHSCRPSRSGRSRAKWCSCAFVCSAARSRRPCCTSCWRTRSLRTRRKRTSDASLRLSARRRSRRCRHRRRAPSRMPSTSSARCSQWLTTFFNTGPRGPERRPLPCTTRTQRSRWSTHSAMNSRKAAFASAPVMPCRSISLSTT